MSRETHDGLPRIRDVCADESEVLALAIARFVRAGYMTADVACWDAAYDAAERLVGPTEGSRLVAAVTGVMRAIRAVRSADWCFLPATCCRVTADERRLLALVTLARQGRSAEVRSKAAHLAGAGDAPRLAEAVREAAEALARVRPLLPAPAPAP